MSIVVINPPVPVLQAADVKAALGLTDGDDYVDMLIAAAQQQIDGPDGWLGRAVGVQTLEYTPDDVVTACLPSARIALPYPPFKAVASVSLVQPDGSYVPLPSNAYTSSGAGGFGYLGAPINAPWPFGRAWQAMKVQFQAGYDAAKVPAPIKQAIMQMVRNMRSMASRDVSLTVDTVYGVGSQQWAPNALASQAGDKFVSSLLSSYRVRAF